MKSKLLFSITVLFLNLFFIGAKAQWIQTIGSSGDIYAFANSGTVFYAGSSLGMFSSIDNGDNWTAINTGLTNTNVRSLCVSGNDVYVGTQGGVFKSTNNGVTWISTNFSSIMVRALAANGSNIFAGTGGGPVNWNQGIFVSTDNGGSWTQKNNGLTNLDIRAVAVKGTKIYAGTYGSTGIFMSTDNGDNWTTVNNGLGAISVGISALTIYGSAIYAGTYAEGVFVTTDDGANWTALNNGLTLPYIRSVAVSGSNIITGGGTGGNVFLSTDNGTNWTAASTGLPTATNIAAVAFTGVNVLAGSTGVWKNSISGMVGIEPVNDNAEISVYPNPFTNSLFAKCFGNGMFSIYDIQGRLIKSCSIYSGVSEVIISDLKQGIYFIEIKTNSNQIIEKLIKN